MAPEDDPEHAEPREEACLLCTLRAAAALLSLFGLACTVLWLVWVLWPETLTDEAVNNKVVNLTDIVCAGVNLVITLIAMSYGFMLHKRGCNPVLFAVCSMVFAVGFITFSIFTIAGYASVAVSQVAAGMFNVSVEVNGGDVFNLTLNNVVSKNNWVFSQAMGAVTLALSVCLLCLAGMACCVSRELIWMHTTATEAAEKEKAN